MGHLRDRIVLRDARVYDRHPYGRAPGRDPELLRRGIEPPSELELAGMGRLLDVELELLHHKMSCIVEEGREVYMSLSISEGIITGDMNCGILTAGGDPAVVATGIFFHSLLNYGPVKYIMKYYAGDATMGLSDGDVFFFNDPAAGGVHALDMFVSTPIFAGRQLVGWAQVGGHQGECGSTAPGGFNPAAVSRWEEGLHVPAMRIGERWQLRRDLFEFLQASVRNPFVFASDLKARVATCKRICERVQREAERRSPQAVAGGLRKILAVTAERARDRLRQVPDGIYRHVLFNDGVGTASGLVRLPTTVVKEGDHMTVLVQGASPENWAGPQHSTWHLMRAAMGVYLFTYFFRGLPPNIGCFDPIEVLVEGPSIANCTEEIAKAEGTTPAAMHVQNLHVIGSKMLYAAGEYDGVCAPFARSPMTFVYAGTNQYGYRVANVVGHENGAGQGARHDADGLDACGFYWASVTDIGEVEEADARLPVMTLSRAIDTDFHGFGRYRGGAPCVQTSMAPETGCQMTSKGGAERVSHSPGLFGGYAAPPNPRFVIRDTDVMSSLETGHLAADMAKYSLATTQHVHGQYELESASQDTQDFSRGDLFISSTGGGGGYGDVLERRPQDVMTDLRAGCISHWVACNVYHVVYDEDSLEIDAAATDAARTDERRARLQRGLSFDEFIGPWLQRRPPAEELRYYGDWPEPGVEHYAKPFWGLFEQAAGDG
jgi:N-methylhydantoinase B/oxoprolinase/acetone carboxylase alpha subunit